MSDSYINFINNKNHMMPCCKFRDTNNLVGTRVYKCSGISCCLLEDFCKMHTDKKLTLEC